MGELYCIAHGSNQARPTVLSIKFYWHPVLNIQRNCTHKVVTEPLTILATNSGHGQGYGPTPHGRADDQSS